MRTDLGEVLRGFVLAQEPEGFCAQGLWQFFREWSDDELDVLGLFAERVAKGRAVYGPLQAAFDGRDWERERDEELVDGLFYACIPALKRRLRRVEQRPIPLARYTGPEDEPA